MSQTRFKLSRAAVAATASLMLVAAACAPSAAPAPTQAPAATSAPAAQATTAPAKPAAPTTAPAQAGASPVASAAPAATSAPAAANKPLQTVNVTVPSYAEISYVVVQYGVDKGFFAAEGLNPQITQAPGATGVKATAAGQFDITLTVGSATQAILKDAPLRIVYVFLQRPLWWLYGRDGIKTFNDLEGKKLAVAATSDATYQLTNQLMQQVGSDIKKVNIVPIGAPPERYQALQAGSVDASVLIFPQNLEADSSGFNNVAFYGDKFKIMMTGLTVSEDTLKNKADMLQAFMRASNKSVDEFWKDKPGAIAAMVKYFKMSQADAEKSYPTLQPLFAPKGIADQETLRQSVQAYAFGLEGVNGDTFPLDKVYDFSLAQKVANGS